MFAIPVILISWVLATGSVALMSGAVEYGVLPTLAVREAVRQGFPDGLGPLSEDYGSGIVVMPDGDPAIGQKLYTLASWFEELAWVKSKVFHMKEEEARMVFDHVEAVFSNGHLINLGKMLEIPEEQRDEDYKKLVQFFKSQLQVAIIPMNKLLGKFPEYRTSTIAQKTA